MSSHNRPRPEEGSENHPNQPSRAPLHYRPPHRDFQPPHVQHGRSQQIRSYPNRTAAPDPRTAHGSAYTYNPSMPSGHAALHARHYGEYYGAPQNMRRDHHGHNYTSMEEFRDPFAASDLERRMLWDAPVGSFGENDSPPRGSSEEEDRRPNSSNASPRNSPRYYQNYSRYPPNFYGHPPPPPPYGYQHPPQPAFQGSPPQPQGGSRPHQQHAAFMGAPDPFPEDTVESVWKPPPELEDSFAPPAPAVSPRRSSETKTLIPSPSSSSSTPEKPKANPFRSPSAAKLSSRSPVRGGLSNLGLSSSFGMMTSPDTHIDELSPLAPSFNLFEREAAETPGVKMTPGELGFDEFSALPSAVASLRGVTRSPVQSTSERRSQKEPPAKVSNAPYSSRKPQPSPDSAASDVKPTELWKGSESKKLLKKEISSASGSTSTAMRFELGHSGLPSSKTQRSLEGINNMMRAQQTPLASSRQSAQHSAHRYSHIRPPPQLTPYHHPASASQMMYHRHPVLPQTPQQRVPMSYHRQPVFRRPVSDSTGKAPLAERGGTHTGAEKNVPPRTEPRSSASKSSKCHCKKSRCLKLYCECFSAMKYCTDCKCEDCKNTPANEGLREKAISEAKAKNSSAFRQQSIGCRCKRSCCLKKYCECFQAGDFCHSQCKCAACENRAGSQKLIDKRRKMKDIKGAEYAVRASQAMWKGKRPPTSEQHQQSSRQPSHRVPLASPPSIARPSPIAPSPGPIHAHSQPPLGYAHPSYLGPPMMSRIGYSPVGMPPAGPLYEHHPPRSVDRRTLPYLVPRASPTAIAPVTKPSKRPLEVTPSAPSPRARAVRISFDPFSSRKRRKSNTDEEASEYFGPSNPRLPRTPALTVFSFLSNGDIFNAALVEKRWSKLAMDKELWNFADDS